MIIDASADVVAAAPGRVNLIGDHTDYTGGLALPIAIDRHTTIVGAKAPAVQLSSDHDTARVDFDIDFDPDIEQLPKWGRIVAAVAREVWRECPTKRSGVSGHVSSTLPIGGGLSSSAALEVAIALALGYDGSPLQLAKLCQRAEHHANGVPSGIMDQLCIVSAREHHAALIDAHDLSVEHIPIPDDLAIEVRHIAPRTLEGSEYATRVAECHEAELHIGSLRQASLQDLAAIPDRTIRQRAKHVITENERVLDFIQCLARHDYRTAGQLMVDSHRSLSIHYAVSTEEVDQEVDAALRERSVYGARMTGGGFGGCIVILREAGTSGVGLHVRASAGASGGPSPN